MALTKISGSVIKDSVSLSGNVSVGGTLTYQDVSNVDAVGLITARSGIDCNGDLDVDGHTNLDNVSIAGVTTFAGAVTTGDHITLTGQNPRITFTDSNHNPDFELYGSAGIFQVWDSTNSVGRLIVNSDGHVDIAGNLDVGAGIDVTGDVTLTDSIIHDGDTDTKIRFPAADTISFETAGAEKLRITSAGTLKFTGQNTSLETAGITHHTNNNLYIRGGTSGLVLGNHDSTNTIHISNSDFIKFETADGSEKFIKSLLDM